MPMTALTGTRLRERRLALGLRQAVDDHPDRQAQEPVDVAHPLGVATGEVVVDGDDMDALARQSVEIRRQRRNKCLALACLHLGYPTKMQSRSTHQLNVEMALSNDSARRFTHHSEGFNQEVV